MLLNDVRRIEVTEEEEEDVSSYWITRSQKKMEL
jgi:hypothetical protein